MEARAKLLLDAARYLGETLEPERVYDRFHELLGGAVQHNGVVVSSYDERDGLIRCEYAWVDGNRLASELFPPLPLNREGGGMQSQVIVRGEPLLANDVRERVKEDGTYYDVDREGHVRKVPESGPPGVQAAMMVPVKHEGQVVGVVQVMSDERAYREEELELVEGLVGQMGAAVRVARLHQAAASARAAEAAAQAVAAEREHAARVLEAVADGIFLVDGDGFVRSWNRAAETITGLARELVLGRPAGDVFPLWPSIAGAVPVAEAGAGGAAARQVTLPVELKGHEAWLAFVAVRSPEGAVYAYRDLTVERSVEEARSDFLATVSHELRTPMTAILGAARTLLRDDVELRDDQRRELLEMIDSQATRLAQVTEEVLLASSLDSGTLGIELAEVDLDAVVRATVHAMRLRLPRGVSIVLRSGWSGLVLGDRDRIEQVLVNLLDNAVKYAPDGGSIVVSTSRLRDAARISVRDRGPGVPPAERSRIFEKFYRRRPHLMRGPGGTGLGLYISRELVERMGGRIGVRSDPGRGSTFFFDLPPA
jgi:signal transduction histidine kinase